MSHYSCTICPARTPQFLTQQDAHLGYRFTAAYVKAVQDSGLADVCWALVAGPDYMYITFVDYDEWYMVSQCMIIYLTEFLDHAKLTSIIRVIEWSSNPGAGHHGSSKAFCLQRAGPYGNLLPQPMGSHHTSVLVGGWAWWMLMDFPAILDLVRICGVQPKLDRKPIGWLWMRKLLNARAWSFICHLLGGKMDVGFAVGKLFRAVATR